MTVESTRCDVCGRSVAHERVSNVFRAVLPLGFGVATTDGLICAACHAALPEERRRQFHSLDRVLEAEESGDVLSLAHPA